MFVVISVALTAPTVTKMRASAINAIDKTRRFAICTPPCVCAPRRSAPGGGATAWKWPRNVSLPTITHAAQIEEYENYNRYDMQI